MVFFRNSPHFTTEDQAMKRIYGLVLAGALLAGGAVSARAQVTSEVYATGFTAPMGLTVDRQGMLWVAEGGTGSGTTAKVSVVTTGRQVYPFLTGLPSVTPLPGVSIGVNDLKFDADGKLLVLMGGVTTAQYFESVHTVDTAGYTPGGTPRTPANILSSVGFGSFVRSQGGTAPNPYRLLVGPGGDWYVADASDNSIIKRTRSTGVLSYFTRFPLIEGAEPVPTGLFYARGAITVGTLTGIPMPPGAARLYFISMSGTITDSLLGFRAIVDVAIDPVDSSTMILQHGIFAGGWQNNTGTLIKRGNQGPQTVLTGINRPSGMAFAANGDLFITSYGDNAVLRVRGLRTSAGEAGNGVPENFSLEQNYPNPFNPSTEIRFALPEAGPVLLEVYDALGRGVATLVDGPMPAGTHSVQFDASGRSSGVYYYRLRAGGETQMRRMVFTK
jgi:sugar lactone lactonase YvrE